MGGGSGVSAHILTDLKLGWSGGALTEFMEGDGEEEEGFKFRVVVVSNQGIKGQWVMFPSFPEVACVGDTVPGPWSHRSPA